MDAFESKLVALCKPLLKAVPEPFSQATEERFRALRARIVGDKIGSIVDGLWSRLRLRPQDRPVPEPSAVLDTLGFLMERGFPGLAGIELRLGAAAFPESEWATFVASAPDPGAIDDWLKPAKLEVGSLEARLLEDPEMTYGTAGLDWLLANSSPRKLERLLRLLLMGAERPRHLPRACEALVEVLEKDSKGQSLAVLVQVASSPDLGIESLAMVVREKPKALSQALLNLPGLASTFDFEGALSYFLAGLCANLHATAGAERRLASARLARLMADILLLPKPTAESDRLVATIRGITRELRVMTTAMEVQKATWVVEPLADEVPTDAASIAITLNGALQIANALSNARRGLSAPALLEALAKNLGLTPIGTAGERVAYNPREHEDTVGGLLPGRPAEVLQPGWRCGAEVVLRSTVKPE